MTATEELRHMLDERGVKWMGTAYAKPTQGHPTNTSLGEEYNNAEFIEYFDGNVLRLFDITPEQAIEATLGRGTCHDESGGDPCVFVCSCCGAAYDHPENQTIAYCPNCGAKVMGA